MLAIVLGADGQAKSVAIYVAYYNFCWRHTSLNGTPAMRGRAPVVDRGTL